MRALNHVARSTGFTALELAIAIAVAGIPSAISYGVYRDYNDATVARRAGQQIAADLALARSHAIKRRGNVSLVVDEAARIYRLRDDAGRLLAQRYFDDDSDLPVRSLTIPGSRDSITFNSRGMVVGATQPVLVGSRDRTFRVTMNALGRSMVTKD
jgi:Tfp pilus assembly protein FimT